MDIAAAIENMAAPQLPEYFSERDCQLIMSALALAKQHSLPYHGSYKAPWLLSEFNDLEWITTNRGREELIDGEWKNAVRINWDIRLPNGGSLADSKYKELLSLNRQIAFLVREGHVGEVSAPVNWKAGVSVQLQLARWMVLYENKFHPEKYGYKLLDQSALNSLCLSLAEGGWYSAQQVSQRILKQIYFAIFGERCPQYLYQVVYNIPLEIRSIMIAWFRDNKFYGRIPRGANAGKYYLKRECIACLINEPPESMRLSWKLTAFCRQFEPDLEFGDLLLEVFQETEMPDQKTRPIEDVVEACCSQFSFESVSTSLSLILASYRHCPDLLPEPAVVSIGAAKKIAHNYTRLSGHHLFIPIDIGLVYLDKAMQFVQLYGDVIIDYYLAVGPVRRKGHSDQETYEKLNSICLSLASEFTVNINGLSKPIAEVLNIDGFQSKQRLDFNLLRSKPTLSQILQVLIGACIICIAILKPSRENELTHLRRNCLYHNNNGYYLNFTLGKSNGGEIYQDTLKPIPTITAKAIQLLQKLGFGLSRLFKDNRKISHNLFYLPKNIGVGAKVASGALLNRHLDIFCDYIALPPDDFGRRWYVRIHEMRKWFLLLFFWSGRFDVLDAARWIAGHTDASHIYSYIQREFPGEELPKLEAEYAIERLLALKSTKDGGNRFEDSGLNELYHTVLNHFQVDSLSMVPDIEWMDYISTLREAEGFILEPHSIYGDDGVDVVGINVSFVLREGVR